MLCFRLHNFTHLWRINKEQFKLSALRTKHNQISDILDSQNNNQHSSLELRIINAIDDHGQRTSLEPIFTPSEAKSKRPSTTCTMGMDFDILFYHVNNAVGDPKFFDSNSFKYQNATISLHISPCRNNSLIFIINSENSRKIPYQNKHFNVHVSSNLEHINYKSCFLMWNFLKNFRLYFCPIKELTKTRNQNI